MIGDNQNIFEYSERTYNEQNDFVSMICWQDAKRFKTVQSFISKNTKQ